MADNNNDGDTPERNDKNQSAFRICAKIFAFWQLTEPESSLLLGLTANEGRIEQCRGSLPPHVLNRLSHILWIARLSTDLYPLDKELSVLWLRRNIFEVPFCGKSPLRFMLTSEASLLETRHFLDMKFSQWGALRDNRNALVYLNDELRVNDEPVDTLMCMAFRVIKSWQLSAQDELSIIGVVLTAERAAHECVVMHAETLHKIRMIVLIDLNLWHLFHDQHKVVAWIRGTNTHPLFAGNSPLGLLCSGNAEVMKLVHKYLSNITP